MQVATNTLVTNKLETNKYSQQGWRCLILILIMCYSMAVKADENSEVTCQGRFVNPITDICWRCLLPISIGEIKVVPGKGTAKRDTKNPRSPLCVCMKGSPVKIPVPGISLGFWEPVRLIDVTRTRFCMVGMGGFSVGSNSVAKMGKSNKTHSSRSGQVGHTSYYHLHYYIYPLIYWLELITDLVCLEKSNFDVAYLSEFDPSWNDEKIQTLQHPEVFIFGSAPLQAACAIDCAAASFKLPIDSMFWCTGCWGNMYPFAGTNGDFNGGVQNSSLLASRILAKMHRVGLAKSTSTSSSKINGPLCRKETALKIKKTQYRMQMVYPKATSGAMGCWPLGFSDMAYSSFKEYPYDGQDWSYVIWRKINCCAL